MYEIVKTKILDFIKSLSDLRTLGQVFFVIIVLLISWSGVKAIQTNYELQKKIVRLQQEVEIQKLENENLKLSNQYLETDQFLELAARRQFGKGAPGEKLLVVPKATAMKFVTKSAKNKEKDKKISQPAYQKNLEAWINFFFRKSQSNLLEG
jgi:cell division protein FtsB